MKKFLALIAIAGLISYAVMMAHAATTFSRHEGLSQWQGTDTNQTFTVTNTSGLVWLTTVNAQATSMSNSVISRIELDNGQGLFILSAAAATNTLGYTGNAVQPWENNGIMKFNLQSPVSTTARYEINAVSKRPM